MKITTDDRRVIIEVDGTVYTAALNELRGVIEGDRFIILDSNDKWKYSSLLKDVTINGTQATRQNIKDLTSALFF